MAKVKFKPGDVVLCVHSSNHVVNRIGIVTTSLPGYAADRDKLWCYWTSDIAYWPKAQTYRRLSESEIIHHLDADRIWAAYCAWQLVNGVSK